MNRTIDDIDILKWILYFSGFNLICEDFSPRSASILSSTAAQKFHTSSTRFSIMLLTLLSNYQAGLYRIIDDIDIHKRMLYFSGFNFSCKDFSPGFPARLSVMLLTLLSNYQISLNHSIDDIDTLKWILYFSGFNFSCKNFFPGTASFPLPALEHQLYTSLGSAPLLPPTLLRLLQSSPARPSTTRITLLLNYQIRLNRSIDDIVP